MSPNGGRLSLENWLKSVHSSYFLRSADFTEICSFHENIEIFIQVHQTGASYLLKLLILLQICSF